MYRCIVIGLLVLVMNVMTSTMNALIVSVLGPLYPAKLKQTPLKLVH